MEKFYQWPSVAPIISLTAVALYLLYRAALPKPIPGIPYHKSSAKSILGDAPALVKHKDETQEGYDWMMQQCIELDSPIIQLFIRPFRRPIVFVTDFREAQDVLLRRTKEFDRSDFFGEMFQGVLPHSHLHRRSDAIWKAQRRLLADTMTPAFLNDVGSAQLYTAAQDMMQLWRLKVTLGEGRPFEATADINHMALDAIWAVTFGTAIGTTQSQVEYLSDLSSVDFPPSCDSAVEFPSAPYPDAFKSIISITQTIEVPKPQTQLTSKITERNRR